MRELHCLKLSILDGGRPWIAREGGEFGKKIDTGLQTTYSDSELRVKDWKRKASVI